MHVVTTRELLEPALAAALRAADTGGDIPILGTVLLQAAGSDLTIVACDMHARVAATIFAEVDVPGAVCAPADLLFQAVKRVAAGAKITLRTEADGLRVSAPRTRLKLSTLPPESFPDLPLGPIAVEVSVPAGSFGAVLADVLTAASTEEIRYYLAGVAVELADGVVTLTATDGHRLHTAALAYAEDDGRDHPAGSVPTLILPTIAAKDIARMAAARKAAPMEIRIGAELKIEVESGGIVYRAKTVDGTFPDWRRIVAAAPHTSQVEAAGLAQAVGRAAVAVERRERDHRGVILEIETDRVVVRAWADGEEAAAAVPATGEALPAIGVNARYLIQALAPFGEGEIILAWDTADTPIQFRAVDDPGGRNLLTLVMPRRIEGVSTLEAPDDV